MFKMQEQSKEHNEMTLLPPPGVTGVFVGQTGHAHDVAGAQQCEPCQPYLAGQTNNENGDAPFLGQGWTPEDTRAADALGAAVREDPAALKARIAELEAQLTKRGPGRPPKADTSASTVQIHASDTVGGKERG